MARQRVINLDYTPTARQALLHGAKCRQIFYGGAAGGGKSHSLRMGEGIVLCLQNPGLQAYLFRRTIKELENNHLGQLRALPAEIGRFQETKNQFAFLNGSILHCGYAEQEADIWRYQGVEMHLVLVDEASQMTPRQLSVLRAWNRIGGWKPSPAYEGVFPRCVFASNPGGPSHDFLKMTFRDPSPFETVFHDTTMKNDKDPDDPGWTSIFIPAKMNDNPYIDKNYEASFGGLPPEMRKAYIDGDWDVVVGAALELLTKSRHMVRDFVPPRHWTRLMCIDWGTARPFSIGWYAVSEGALLKGRDNWDDVWLPAGALIRYREWYGWNGNVNEGCRMSSQAVARRILEIEEDEPPIDRRIADSQMWAQSDGPTPAERFSQAGVPLVQCKKDRMGNYWEVRARLAGNEALREDGETGEFPMLFATAVCRHFWRTLPTLTLDETEPEKGPDNKLEDHVYDELAYLCRSRPYVSTEETRWHEYTKRARGTHEVQDWYATE